MTDDGPRHGRLRGVVRAAADHVVLPLARGVQLAGEEPDRSRRPHRLGIDLVVAADGVLTLLLLAVAYGELDAANIAHDRPYANLTLLFLVGTLTAPLLIRDQRPALAWLLSALATLWTIGVARNLLAGAFVTAPVFVPLYCLYTVATRSGRRLTVVLWAVTLIVGLSFVPNNMIGVAIMVTVPVLLGLNVAARRRAQRQLAVETHRHREESAVLQERQRIARELHDVVAHHMSVIAIQAEAAPYKVPDPPAELTESFTAIRASALDGLTELRRVLGVLRTEPPAGADVSEPAPQPGLRRLDDLIASARAGGLDATVTVTGEPAPLPQGVDLSAFRILQESLSNAMRHAPGSAVRVGLSYEPSHAPTELRLYVTNGPGVPDAAAGRTDAEQPRPAAGGHGMVGMRERAAMLGGELHAAATADGGFAVTAVLPLHLPEEERK